MVCRDLLLILLAGGAFLCHPAAASNSTMDGADDFLGEGVPGFGKPLFSPFTPTDAFGSVLAFFTVVVAAAGGIGGGGLLVPLYTIVLQLGAAAVPLSKATIFGCALGTQLLNMRKRHPNADRPLIDYDVALMLEPMTLAGTVVGVVGNKICPGWLVTILLIWLLTRTALKTLKKGQEIWAKESKTEENKQLQLLSSNILFLRIFSKEFSEKQLAFQWKSKIDAIKASKRLHFSLMDESGVPDDDGYGQAEGLSGGLLQKEEGGLRVSSILREEASVVPLRKVFLLFVVWCVVLVVSMVKGGHGAPSVVGIQCGTLAYWAVTLAVLPAMILFTGLMADHLIKSDEQKRRVGYELVEGDVRWNPPPQAQPELQNESSSSSSSSSSSTLPPAVNYPLQATMAGVASGMLGIGGGMVKGPLMLDMGMLPSVSSATAGFMILFTASSTTVQFVLLGMLQLDYALWFGGIGFLGAVTGNKVVGLVIKKYKKNAVLVLFLAAVIGLSAVVMGVSGILKIGSQLLEADWEKFKFHGLC